MVIAVQLVANERPTKVLLRVPYPPPRFSLFHNLTSITPCPNLDPNRLLFAQGPSSTVRATFRGMSSLLRHASAGTLSSVSGVTNALSRNLGSRGGVVRPIAGTMGLVRERDDDLIQEGAL